MKLHIWPLLATRALLAFAFGILALTWPGVTLFVLVVLFGAWCLVDGVSLLISTIRAGKGNDRRGAEILGGLSGIGLGVLTLVWPGVTALALTFLIAAWAIVTGVAETVAAIRWRKLLKGEWVLILAGVASVIFGLALAIAPVAGALVLSQLIGIYAVVYAGLLGALTVRVHRWERNHEVVVIRAASTA